MKKICVYVGSRANYSSCFSIMKSIQNHKELELQVIIGAAAVLQRFGDLECLLKEDGFEIDYKVYSIVEGGSPLTMSKSTGLGMLEVSSGLDLLKPDVLVVIGDRFDVMAPVLAASLMNIRVAHTMGGEITGTIDESLRHAITKFAHYHYPANELAATRIQKMGEDPQYIFNFGCPRMDAVKEFLKTPMTSEEINQELIGLKGVGNSVDVSEPFLLVSYHPVTTEFGDNRHNVDQLINALDKLTMPTIMLWPNVDAGSDEVTKSIRTYRENFRPDWLQLHINLPISLYMNLMNITACLIGNSSSAIREGAFIGTPSVNIGTRQNFRQRGDNIIDADNNAEKIFSAITTQISNGAYESDNLYGSGNAGARIADSLAQFEPPLQKWLKY